MSVDHRNLLSTLPGHCIPAAQQVLHSGEPVEWSYGHRDHQLLHDGLSLAVKVQYIIFPLAIIGVGLAAWAGAFPAGPGYFGLSLAATCFLIAIVVGLFYFGLSILLVRLFANVGLAHAAILTGERLILLRGTRLGTMCSTFTRALIEDARVTTEPGGLTLFVLGPYRVRIFSALADRISPGATDEHDGHPPGAEHSLGSGPQAETAARELLTRLGFPPEINEPVSSSTCSPTPTPS